jgi:hypothetical protein
MDAAGKTSLILQSLKVYAPQLVSLQLAKSRESNKLTELQTLVQENARAQPMHPDQPLPAPNANGANQSRPKYPPDILNKFKSKLPGINDITFSETTMALYFTLCNSELAARIVQKSNKINEYEKKLDDVKLLLKTNLDKSAEIAKSISQRVEDDEENLEHMQAFTDENADEIKRLLEQECSKITIHYLARESVHNAKKKVKSDKLEVQRLDDERPIVLTHGDLKKLKNTIKGAPTKKNKNFQQGGKKGPAKPGKHARKAKIN